jgi:membrane fusion protein (multidrug efflux system)
MSSPDNRDTPDSHDHALRAAHDHRDHSEPEDLGFALPPPSRTSRTGVVVVLAVLVGGGFALGWSQRSRARATAPAPSSEARATRVEVIKPGVSESDHAITLPGTVRALEQTKIYPRVTGYVRKWHVDLGD